MERPWITGRNRKWLWCGIVLLLLVQGVTRFAVQPSVGFVLDDWAFWADAEKQPSATGALLDGLKSPTRPLGTGVQQMFFHLFQGHALYFGCLSVISYSLSLSLVFLLVRELTGKSRPGFVAGLLFATLPNLCGHFHWLCLTTSPGQLVYLISAYWMVRHARRGECWTFWGGILAFASGLGIYEVGVFLPAAFAVLLWRQGWKRVACAMVPFCLALGAYVAWRLTASFGLGKEIGVAPQFEPGLTWYGVTHTAAAVLSWWMGSNVWKAIGDGAVGFSELPCLLSGGLLFTNAVLVGLSEYWLKTGKVLDKALSSGNRFDMPTQIMFGVVWIGATYSPVFLGYLAPRLNYLPAFGIVFLLTLLMERFPRERWIALLLALVFAGMVVGEGDTKNWADAIRFQRNVFKTMNKHRPEWKDMDVLWLNTKELSQRLTPGIIDGNRHHIDTIAEYRNAGLLRGFGPSAMADLILKEESGPRVILDVEYGAHAEKGMLKWHERYNPNKPRQTPMERVWCLDALTAGQKIYEDER